MTGFQATNPQKKNQRICSLRKTDGEENMVDVGSPLAISEEVY